MTRRQGTGGRSAGTGRGQVIGRRSAALLVAPLLLLAACGQPAQTTRTSQGQTAQGLQTRVDLDTPQLRALKRTAGVEPCPSGRAGSAHPSASPSPGPAHGGALPDVTLACLGGGPAVDLARLRGPLVLNLWAQWCGPCRQELPYYQQLHERAGSMLRVLGVDYQDPQPKAALELVARSRVTYPLLADPDGALRVPFRVRGLPGIVFVRPDGSTSVVYTVVRSYPALRRLVSQNLGVGL
jgi:thiol-disulfide isomerase/thioredoxin